MAQAQARERRAAKRTGRVDTRQRGAGEPEAPPTPGKPDPSKPEIVLPPQVQQMLDGLRRGVEPPRNPALPKGADADTLLDYLLAP